MNVIKIDGQRIHDATSLHTVLAEAFGFPTTYGRNIDALVDCLTSLDNPKAGMSRIHVVPGQIVTLAIAEADELIAKHRKLLDTLTDALAFVNWRRLERGQPSVIALAFQR
jgi:hypothetical protein